MARYFKNLGKDGSEAFHCVKSVRVRNYSGPYFPAFGLKSKKLELYRATWFDYEHHNTVEFLVCVISNKGISSKIVIFRYISLAW